MSLHFTLDMHEIEEQAARLSRVPTLDEIRTTARSAMGTYVEIAKEESPRRTGSFAGSLGYASKLLPKGIELQLRSGGATGPGVGYARYLVDGTGVYHSPEKREAWDVDGFQRFEVSGEEVVAMSTHHEGQKPNDLEARSLERLKGALPQIYATAGRRLVRWITHGAAA